MRKSETLHLNGVSIRLRVRAAEGFWSRLIGFWPSPRCHGVEAIVFPKCSSVHTFAMLRRIDVVFLDDLGRVVRVEHRVPPWRVLRDSRATTVLELRAGLAAAFGVVSEARLSVVEAMSSQRRHQQKGSAMLEFFLAATIVLLPMISGILEFAQLASSRQILAIATSEAARSLAIATMDDRSPHLDSELSLAPGEASIRVSLARGLLPLFGGSFDEAQEFSAGFDRWQAALIEVARPDRLTLSLSEGLVRTADVEIGRLEVRYCRELFFAPASYVLPQLLHQWEHDPFARRCYAEGRIPLAASAPVSVSRHP